MYTIGIQMIHYGGSNLDFSKLYRDFLAFGSMEGQEEGSKVKVEDRGFEEEKLTKGELESLAKNCPKKCSNCSFVDCWLLYGWNKDGDEFWHTYPLLGKYLWKEKQVVLYVKNIDDACGEEPTYKGVLSTYIHELFHAFFHYVTEQKQAEYNYIREIEEAMAEFSTLVFLRLMKQEDTLDGWHDVFDWAFNEIGKKQQSVGNLSAYGFGRYLFDSIRENEAFDWINKYAERLGCIDEEDELVKQYKQMVCPCYPTEPDKCLELLRKILFETDNKPIKPRDVNVNRNRNMKNEAIIESIQCLLKGYQAEKDEETKKSLKYLISQSIREYDIPAGNWHLSEEAHRRWNELTTDDIKKYHYRDEVNCDKLSRTVTYNMYKGASKTGSLQTLSNGSTFPFNNMFHEDHVIPVSLIFGEMVKMKPVSRKAIEDLLNGIHICVLLKEEDRKRELGRTKGRCLDYKTTIKNVYEKNKIKLVY